MFTAAEEASEISDWKSPDLSNKDIFDFRHSCVKAVIYELSKG